MIVVMTGTAVHVHLVSKLNHTAADLLDARLETAVGRGYSSGADEDYSHAYNS